MMVVTVMLMSVMMMLVSAYCLNRSKWKYTSYYESKVQEFLLYRSFIFKAWKYITHCSIDKSSSDNCEYMIEIVLKKVDKWIEYYRPKDSASRCYIYKSHIFMIHKKICYILWYSVQKYCKSHRNTKIYIYVKCRIQHYSVNNIMRKCSRKK